MQTPHGLRKKLRSPLHEGAIKQNADAERSAVNPMYIIERLNDCFGEDGWEAVYRVQESGSQMIVVECLLSCWLPWVNEPRPEKAQIRRRAFGGHSNADRGDAFKGACTDALTKAASHLGIAHQVYKGLYDLQPQAVAEPEPVKRDGRKINQAQAHNFSKAVRESGKSQQEVDEFLLSMGITGLCSEMLKVDYDNAMDWAKRKAEAA